MDPLEDSSTLAVDEDLVETTIKVEGEESNGECGVVVER